MVTTVSIRLALRKLAEITCGIAPSLIRVTARREDSGRVYSVAIPWEYRDEVFAFLRQQLDFEIHIDGSLLVLTEEQARAVLALAYRIDVGPTVTPSAAGEEFLEAEQIKATSQTA